MLTSLFTLLAVALALLATSWLPDPATRLAAGGLLALSLVLAIISFRRIAEAPPAPLAAPCRWTRARSWRIAGALVLVAGMLWVLWALFGIWKQPFAWDLARHWGTGLLLMLGGGWMIGGKEGLRLQRHPPATPAPDMVPPAPRRVGPRPSGYKLRALGLDAPQPGDLPEPSAASSTPPPLQPVPSSSSPIPIPAWIVWTLLALIMAAAIWLRLAHIQQMPPGVFIDETNAALDGLRILEGRPDSLFGTGWFETPNGFVYLQTLFFRLLGTTFVAIKLQSLLPGILTVLALYFLARELFGVRTALFSTAFLAFNRWHFNMSRWGWNELYPPLIMVLSLLFILRGVRRRHWGDWLLAGLLLGLGMYTYLAIRLVVVVIFLYLGLRLLLERGFLRRQWQGLLLFFVIYALTFAPLGFTYIKSPFTFLNRTEQVSIKHDIDDAGGDLQPLWQSVKRHALMFQVKGDLNPRHNLPGRPMLDPITGAFFLLGLAWALWRWRDHRHALLLLWVPVVLLGGILSRLNEAPQGYRVLAVVPAIALLAGEALDLSLRGMLAPFAGRRWMPVLAGLVAVVGLSAAGWLNYDLYFHQQMQDAAVYTAFSPLETTVAREVLAKRADHRLYLSPRLYYFSPLRFFAYEPTRSIGIDIGPWHYSPFPRLGGGLDHPGYQLADPALDLPLPDLDGDSALFLLDLHFQYVLDLFRYYYPGTQSEIIYDRLQRPLYLSVTIPGDEITALHVHNRAAEQADMRGLYIPQTADYALTVLSPQATAPVQIAIDGQVLPPGMNTLGKGLHALQLLNPPDLPPETPVLSWDGPAGSGPVPDAYLFRKAPSGQGLLGTYYVGSDWTPPPFMQRIDPLLLTSWTDQEPIFGPFSATWTGFLLVPVDGPYRLQLNADDGVRLWLDGLLIAESLLPDTVNQIASSVQLTAGSHAIRIDYFQRGGGKALEFFWQPPSQPLQPVAPAYLRPGG
ncbi:MAG: hypothetical protein GXP37_14140 [Chloroflexi bacterium]|nr:hypothetical protein [Chloroflexota bacterium]